MAVRKKFASGACNRIRQQAAFQYVQIWKRQRPMASKMYAFPRAVALQRKICVEASESIKGSANFVLVSSQGDILAKAKSWLGQMYLERV